MHISIEEVLKNIFESLDNIQTSFWPGYFFLIVSEFGLFGGPLADMAQKSTFGLFA